MKLLSNMKTSALAVMMVPLAVVSGAANAALPTGIDTAITAAQVDALALADLIWPIVIAIFTSLLIFKLFKRYGSKI